MRVTRRHLRRIIEEEYRLGARSDNLLIQEGIFDFLDKIFGWLEGFLKNAKQEAMNDAASAYDAAVKTNVKSVASDMGVTRSTGSDKETEDGEEDAPIETIGDLDLKNPEHQKVYWRSVGPAAQQGVEKVMGFLETAAGVKKWTPEDDTDEAQKKWQETEGKNAQAIFSALGVLKGSLSWHGKAGIEKAASASDAETPGGGPAGGIKALISDANLLKDIWGSVSATGEDDFGIPAAMDKIIAKATAIGEAIAAAGKEEAKENPEAVKECVQLRRVVNALTLSEGRGDGKVRFTKKYLSELIRHSIMNKS